MLLVEPDNAVSSPLIKEIRKNYHYVVVNVYYVIFKIGQKKEN